MRYDHELHPSEIGLVYDPSLPMSMAIHGLIIGALALRDHYDATQILYQARYDQARADWEAFRVIWCGEDAHNRPGSQLSFDAPPVKQPPFLWSRHQLEDSASLLDDFPRMLLLALVASYDTFVANVLRAMYKEHPERLKHCDRPLLWRDIDELELVGEVRGLVIEREVTDLLHLSHVEQLSSFHKRCSIKEAPQFDELAAFTEVTERRNLFAHGGGRVSAHYLKTCGRLAPPGVAPGDYLTIDANYFRAACETIAVVAVILSQTVWRATGGPADNVDADRDLAQLIYTLLAKEEWVLANRLLRFAVDLGRRTTEPFSLVFRINLAQTYKWLGDQSACNATLATVDWTAKDVAFHLSAAVLMDKFDDAEQLMTIAAAGNMKRSAFDHWPVFREFRHSEQFGCAYRRAYGTAPMPGAGS